MSSILIHVPEGDHNPYEPAGWSRHPLLPTRDEPFRVGVRSSQAVDAVHVEWEDGGVLHTDDLTRKGDSWIGEVTTAGSQCRYRFAVPGVPDATTQWFVTPVESWADVSFHTVDTRDDRVIVTGDHDTVLTFTFHDGGRLRWDFGDPLAGHTASVEVLHIDVEDGAIVISHPEGLLSMRSALAHTDGRVSRRRLQWGLSEEERLFGTGQRFDRFDQRGCTPDVRVYEQYKQQGSRTYFPLPWLMSTAGYGLAIDGATRVEFDLGASNPDHATATIPNDAASGYWYFGEPREVLEHYAADIGRPSPVPIWAYGPWMSGNEWNTQRRVTVVVQQTIDYDIPSTVIVIEAWSDETTFYLFNDTTYEAVPGGDDVSFDAMRFGESWPDPKKMVDWLHEHGVRVLLWQIPVLKDTTGHSQHDRDIAYAEAHDLTVKTVDGDSYRNRGWWFPGSRIIDFTNPEAAAWWFDKRRYLIDQIGADGFKTDGGEHLWGTDVVAHDGASGHEAANTYPTHYLGAYHSFLTEAGHDRPLIFSRAGFTGSQALPAHWAGDEDSTWDAFRASLTAGLTAAMSGISFWGWDLAGFSGPLPQAELYKRATAMAAFCPIMQYHSEHNEHRTPLADRTPWNVAEQTSDPTVIDIYRFYARLRMNLVPYLHGLGEQTARNGTPIMRPLVLDYPHDPIATGIDDQFLLGDSVLVAPILASGTESRDVYIPGPGWTDLWTGARVEPGWIQADAPPDRIPVYLAPGACVPLWLGDQLDLATPVALPGEDDGHLVLLVTPGDATRTVTDPISGRSWTVGLSTDADGLSVASIDSPTEVDIWLHGTDQTQTLAAGAASCRFPLSR